MISLAKYLRSQSDGDEPPHIRAISLLVQGMELHTLDCNKEDHERFRSGLAELQQRLLPEIPDPDLFVLVGQIIKTFEAYNRQTTAKLRAQFSELQAIIAAFTTAVAAMVSASDTSLKRLGQIRTQLGSAETIEDLRLLKTHLCDCLNVMAREVEEHRKSSASGMQRLAEGARKLESSIQRTRPGTADVTGLPGRAEAETALTRVAAKGIPALAVLFALKLLKQVNSRFGDKVGDGLLERLSSYLASGVNPDEGLFRWSGPALLAIVTRPVPVDQVRREVGRLVASIPEYEVGIGARTAMIPVSVGWAVFPVTRPAERLIGQLDAFVASQNAEDAHVAR